MSMGEALQRGLTARPYSEALQRGLTVVLLSLNQMFRDVVLFLLLLRSLPVPERTRTRLT